MFVPGDWVWVHFRKERFPNQRKNKLDARGDGPFQVLERINDNAYKIDLPGEYGVSATFNVSDLSPFDHVPDLRTNLFEEGGNDTNYQTQSHENQGSKDPLVLPSGPVTRSKAKKLKAAMNLHIQEQVTQELTELAFGKCLVKLEDTPKLLTLLKVCNGDSAV